jgi:hypothetical protein
MRELARFKREGGEFDGKVVRFKHWLRVTTENIKKAGIKAE